MSYVPGPPPVTYEKELQDSIRAIWEELRQISSAIQNPVFEKIALKQLNVAPNKRSDGDLFYADGTNFNPGAGKGIYWDDGTTRTKL